MPRCEKYVNAADLHTVSTRDIYIGVGIDLYSIGAPGVDKREYTSVVKQESLRVNVECIAECAKTSEYSKPFNNPT